MTKNHNMNTWQFLTKDWENYGQSSVQFCSFVQKLRTSNDVQLTNETGLCLRIGEEDLDYLAGLSNQWNDIQ